MIDINDLTLGQVNQLTAMQGESNGLNNMVGKKVIVRTYNAGVWFGIVTQKSGNEVILSDARRMWRWHAAQSISLSAVAIHGINQDKSKICESVGNVWLEAVEIIPCTATSIDSLEGAENVKAS